MLGPPLILEHTSACDVFLATLVHAMSFWPHTSACYVFLATHPQGFEWNKYNQTHYDTDSPPPKIVQGYKFNVRAIGPIPNLTDPAIHDHFPSFWSQIFFPDLINKRQAPTYTLVSSNPPSAQTLTILFSQTPCDDNKEFAILRFHAGPPYEVMQQVPWLSDCTLMVI